MSKHLSEKQRIKYDRRQAASASFLSLGKTILWFWIALLYMELLLFLQIHDSLSGFSVWHVLFLLPVSAALSALTGWRQQKPQRNRLLTLGLTLLLSIFYMADFIYFQTFGSLFSVSMMGMGGDAITNFWWSLKGTIVKNLGVLLLFMIPTACQIVFAVLSKPKAGGYKPLFHAAAAILAVLLWLGVAALLPLTGNTDYSAYGAYHSHLTDTDTGSEKLGVLANTLIETKSYLFGAGDNGAGLEPAAKVNELIPEEKPEIKEPEPSKSPEIQTPEPDTEEPELQPEPEQTPEPAEPVVDTSPNVFPGLNFARLGSETENKKIVSLCEYMNSLPGTARNEYTGLFEGYNLIYICAEAFSTYALNEQVTPTLCKLASEGIVLNNYYNAFKNTTTNGEYALLTGIWPDVSRTADNGTDVGSMAQSAKKNMFTALGNCFNTTGLTSLGYHNYKGSYYSRNKSLPNMGFTCKFKGSGLSIKSGWPTSDYEMLQQSVDDYINEDQFCVYYMTFSGHGDYAAGNTMYDRNISTVKKLLGDTELSSEAVGYLACNYELEKAMTYLLERLEEAGKLENTVIVMGGDHYPYYLDKKGRNSLAGHAVDMTFEIYKSTCILWNGGLEEPIQVDTPCCNVDILPTILNLFNIPYDSRLYAGTDVFGDGVHVAALYNKSFVTDVVKYNSKDGTTEWLVDTSAFTEAELQAYLESVKETVKQRYEASVTIGGTDFYQFVWDHYDVPALKPLEKSEKE